MNNMSASPSVRRFRRGINLSAIGIYALVSIYVLVIIVPFYYVIVSAFKDNSEIFSAPLSLPNQWNLLNFFEAQEKAGLVAAMGRTFMIVVVTELLLIGIGFPAAYAIARIPIGLAKIGELYFGIGFLLPVFAVLVPIFLMAAATGLLFKPVSLILFYLAAFLPLTVILLASTMREIPYELEESAVIDGANRFQIMLHVILPLARSGLVTVITRLLR